MKYLIETERLRLREWGREDVEHLASFLQDEEVMYAYEHAFSDEEVASWLTWNLDSYQEKGYGLWGIEEKKSGEIIGECGLTRQVADNGIYLEIGYHLKKSSWHQGFAVEAARACRDYAFHVLDADETVSIVRDTNIASMNVAIRNGMVVKKRFIKNYLGKEMPHYLFSVKRDSVADKNIM